METEAQVLEKALKAIGRAKMADAETLRGLADAAIARLGRSRKTRLPSRLVLSKSADSEAALESERQYTRDLEQSVTALDTVKKRVEALIEKYLDQAGEWDDIHHKRDNKHAIECDCGLMARELRLRASELNRALRARGGSSSVREGQTPSQEPGLHAKENDE